MFLIIAKLTGFFVVGFILICAIIMGLDKGVGLKNKDNEDIDNNANPN